MTVQERNKKIKNLKKRRIAKRRLVLLITALVIITAGSIVYGSIMSAAKNPATDVQQYKYYKSITIQQGDSLWSIAEEYRTDDYADAQEYIDELKTLNGLTSETIHEGQHLVVAYYNTEIR